MVVYEHNAHIQTNLSSVFVYQTQISTVIILFFTHPYIVFQYLWTRSRPQRID